MDIPLIFVAVITCFLAVYTMNRFIQRPGIGSVLILGMQLLATTVIFFSLSENVLTTPLVEIGILLAGVFIPIPVILHDHSAFFRKLKKMGVSVSFIDKKEKPVTEKWNVACFTTNAELWKNEIPALEVYRSIRITDPELSRNVKKQLIFIQRLINLEKYETAAERYRILYSLMPDCAAVAYNTGYLLCFIGKYREAYKVLRNSLVLLKKNKHKDADNTVEEERKHDSFSELEPMVQFYTGYALYHIGKFEHAIRHFQKVLAAKPDLTVVYKNIARAFLSLGMDDKAVEFMEKGRLDLRDNSMRVVLGSIYYHKGDTKKAIAVLDEVARADEKVIEALKWKGKAAIKEKMYDKAIECFTELIQMEPDDPFHFYHLALAQRSAGEKASALKTYEKGISQHPSCSILLYNAGTLMDEMGLQERAADVLYKSLQGDEYLEDAVNYLGILLGQMKRYRESVQVFDKGVKQFDKSYQLWFNRGIVLEMARRQEDAVASFERAYDLNREDLVLIYHYTGALLKIRDYAKAIRICKKGLNNYPDDCELIYGLSKVYAQMGEKEVAVELLKKVLSMDPAYLTQLRKDLDFKALQNHPGYRSLLVS